LRFSFEVRETDLMGRIGRLKVKGKTMETPCFLPVIHPVNSGMPLSQFMELGYDSLMTNSLILYKRRREEALEKGIHRLLGFDGILMTDSGGYQVLEYGGVGMTPSEIAEFQSRIGSDLAVTLDKPTGLSHSREYAKRTVDVSLMGAKETLKNHGSSDTIWIGPIQGGLFLDLVSFSTRELVKSEFRFLALGSPTEIMENYLFSELVRMILTARSSMPFSMPLHLFGAGHPFTLPISVALGCDTFDSASYILFAKQGRYMTEQGTLELNRMGYLPCSCPICNSTSPSELLNMEDDEKIRRLSLHNLYLLRQEILKCKEAIVEGRLWDLVEERANAHPDLMKAFVEFTKHGDRMIAGTQFLKERGLMIRSRYDARRPELESARQHLGNVMWRRAKIALLIVSDEGKPMTRMRAYREILKRSKKMDIYKIHPYLSIYPAELEFVYPFAQTICSDGKMTRKIVLESLKKLKNMGYEKVLLCDGSSLNPHDYV
jgi:7-cyano-7-deazaguanine tRNA-ribosyltransferase